MNRSVRLLALVAVVGSLGAAAAEAVEPCPSPQDALCRAAERDAARGVVKLIASVRSVPEAAPLSLLAVIPSPPPRTLGAKLWDLVKSGVRVDGTVAPKFDDGPPLPGGGKRGFQLAMVGVKIRFGETLVPELWGEVVGIELLDHSLSLDGTFRPF
jgi:hypothetical protein